jgi:hypothetical protein
MFSKRSSFCKHAAQIILSLTLLFNRVVHFLVLSFYYNYLYLIPLCLLYRFQQKVSMRNAFCWPDASSVFVTDQSSNCGVLLYYAALPDGRRQGHFPPNVAAFLKPDGREN